MARGHRLARGGVRCRADRALAQIDRRARAWVGSCSSREFESDQRSLRVPEAVSSILCKMVMVAVVGPFGATRSVVHRVKRVALRRPCASLLLVFAQIVMLTWRGAARCPRLGLPSRRNDRGTPSQPPRCLSAPQLSRLGGRPKAGDRRRPRRRSAASGAYRPGVRPLSLRHLRRGDLASDAACAHVLSWTEGRCPRLRAAAAGRDPAGDDRRRRS